MHDTSRRLVESYGKLKMNNLPALDASSYVSRSIDMGLTNAISP